jgi:ribonuclease E
MKGAALTSYLSFPGRYMVVMPGSDSAGVSRKVESEGDRKKLKEMAAEMKIPEGIGYIIRTEALGKTKTDLNKDLKSLLKLNQDILTKAKKAKAPALIYQELDLVIRTIRDYFTAEIDEVLVDNPEVYQQARDFFKATMPKQEQIVKLHQEKRPIFSKYQLEEQIDQIYEKKVPLKSGGSLVIEPTEALVSIDVNSGKSTGERGVEDTAYKTNMEAAEEVARQLRLRDLAGLIVIDLIDMRDKKHMIEVEKTLKNALKQDKARVTVGRISQFGMLEMSRQRIKQTLEQASYLECPHCGGRGKVKSVENMAISFLRKVHASAAKGTQSEVRGALPLEVAYYLLNRKKRELAQIENDYDIEVTIKGKPSFLMNQLELEVVKRDKPYHPEAHAETAQGAPIPANGESAEATLQEPTVAASGEEGKPKKRKRRKKKGRGEGESSQTGEWKEEQSFDLTGQPAAVVEPIGGEAAAEDLSPEEAPGEEQKKKRKRKRRRGSKGHATEGAQPEASPVEAEGEAGQKPEPLETASGEGAGHVEGGTPAEEQKKKRKRKRKRGAKAHPADAAHLETPAGGTGAEKAPAPESAQAEAIGAAGAAASEEEQKKKRKRKRRRGPKAPGAEEHAGEIISGAIPAVAEKAEASAEPAAAAGPANAKRVARLSRKKEAAPAAEPAPVTVPAAVTGEESGGTPVKKARAAKPAAKKKPAPPEQVAEAAPEAPKPARKRAPRKKSIEPDNN